MCQVTATRMPEQTFPAEPCIIMGWLLLFTSLVCGFIVVADLSTMNINSRAQLRTVSQEVDWICCIYSHLYLEVSKTSWILSCFMSMKWACYQTHQSVMKQCRFFSSMFNFHKHSAPPQLNALPSPPASCWLWLFDVAPKWQILYSTGFSHIRSSVT